MGPGTFLSAQAQFCSLLVKWVVQVAVPEQSLDQEGGKVVGMQEDTVLTALMCTLQ